MNKAKRVFSSRAVYSGALAIAVLLLLLVLLVRLAQQRRNRQVLQ